MSNDVEREEFEKLCAGRDYDLTRDGDGYFDIDANSRWDWHRATWQAARSNMLAVTEEDVSLLKAIRQYGLTGEGGYEERKHLEEKLDALLTEFAAYQKGA